MKIKIIAVGKLKEKYLKQGISEYAKRLTKYCHFEIIEVADERVPELMSEKEKVMVRDIEGQRLLSKVPDQATVFLLAIEGDTLSSEEFAQQLEKMTVQGQSQFCFIIGGSIGVSEAVYQRANAKISFGRMTYPHQLMRLILTEQIYRTFRIRNNEPYHK